MRVASQLIFCSPQEILRGTVVEQNDYGMITKLFSLDENIAETESTLFFDGILSAGIISLKEESGYEKYILENYQYIDLSKNTHTKIVRNQYPLIIDFGTSCVVEVNNILKKESNTLKELSLYEVIAACTYYPAIIAGKTGKLIAGYQTEIILWEKTDLIKKTFTDSTVIRQISLNNKTKENK